ncbi:MAG: tRNA lysidine(34) synthetase [Myxococcaceae bacterium]
MKTKTRRLLQPIWNILDAVLPREGLILCVSGGSDSRALMEAVAHWPNRFENIHVLSVDHGTRSETCLEAENVCARARVLGFGSRVLSLEPHPQPLSTKWRGEKDKFPSPLGGEGLGVRFGKSEANLRQARYGVIWRAAAELGIRAIATAHTQDDQAEGFVMDLMGQGGGAEGSGMLACSSRSEGLLLRPLLNFSRAYLIAVLTELGQEDYFIDPTNLHSLGKRVLVRDFLRLHDMPQERLAGLAEKRRADVEALQAWACDLIEVHSAGQVSVRFKPETPEAVLFQAFKKALSSLLPDRDLRSAHRTLSQMAKSSQVAEFSYDLPGCQAILSPDRALFKTI